MEHILEFESKIDCSVEKLFEFHSDTNNLPLITPPGTTVDIIKLDKELQEGNVAVLKIKKGLLSFVWELIFEKVVYPNLIVDVATRSPFKAFRHEHHFIKVNDTQSILRDKVTFSLPLEPLSILAVWFVKKDMQKMFTYRHQKTKETITS